MISQERIEMVEIPHLKKSICSFLRKEDGKISKEKLVKTGILLSGVAIATLKSAVAACPSAPKDTDLGHCNTMSLAKSGTSLTGSHSHSHASHASHGSHGSHGSCGWVSW